jgi:hypothetical protein
MKDELEKFRRKRSLSILSHYPRIFMDVLRILKENLESELPTSVSKEKLGSPEYVGRRLDLQVDADVSEKHAVFIFRV